MTAEAVLEKNKVALASVVAENPALMDAVKKIVIGAVGIGIHTYLDAPEVCRAPGVVEESTEHTEHPYIGAAELQAEKEKNFRDQLEKIFAKYHPSEMIYLYGMYSGGDDYRVGAVTIGGHLHLPFLLNAGAQVARQIIQTGLEQLKQLHPQIMLPPQPLSYPQLNQRHHKRQDQRRYLCQYHQYEQSALHPQSWRLA